MFIESLYRELESITKEYFGEVISKTETATSGRSVIATLLFESGLTDTEIASLMQISRQGVNKLRQRFVFREKHSWYFRQQTAQIRKLFASYQQRITEGATH